MFDMEGKSLFKKHRAIAAKLFLLIPAFGLVLTAGKAANAATFKALQEGATGNVFTECINDGHAIKIEDGNSPWKEWVYSHDSALDGVQSYNIGGNVYEIYGQAVKETIDSIFVVIKANLPMTGTQSSGALDGNIGWGDWFLNLSGKDFSTASKEGSLFGVRFAGTNDSPVGPVGLYGNVTATSTTSINDGFSSLQVYNARVRTYGCQGPGCGPSLGDLPADTTYFDQSQSLNAIASGNFLSDIMYLSQADLIAEGFDSNQLGGSQTIAFKIDKDVVCNNAGICESVPEPSSAVGLAALGLIFGAHQLRKRSKVNT